MAFQSELEERRGAATAKAGRKRLRREADGGEGVEQQHQLPARAREVLRRWLLGLVAVNDCLAHAETGIVRHLYQQAALEAEAQHFPGRPPGLGRYCDAEGRINNYNQRGTNDYAVLCADNARAVVRLLEDDAAAGKLRGSQQEVLEALDAGVSELRAQLQRLAHRTAAAADRVVAVLPTARMKVRKPPQPARSRGGGGRG